MVDNFRFGIEEEYFLVDAQTKRVARRMPEKFLMAANKATDGLVTGEFLQSQIEVTTSPHASLPNAILSHAADNGTEFMVLGGYGHSRLREFILGGVTRSILGSMTVPVLMSH